MALGGQTAEGPEAAAGFRIYLRLLADPQARAFSAAGLLARMQISMTGLSIVLLISIVTGSFARAGLVTAVATLTGAAVTPAWGRLIDRVGQARVLVLTSVLFTVGVGLIILTVLSRQPLGFTIAAAVLAGLGISQAGSAVRARWSHRLHDPAERDVAFALEAMVDEVVFIVGPVLATLVATTIQPSFGLALSAALTLTGSLLLAGQSRTQPPAHPRSGSRPVGTIPWRTIAPVAVCCIALGVIFGGMEVAIIAFTTERNILAATGLFTVAWALGSLVAGFVTGTICWQAPATRRFRIGATCLAASLLPLPFLGSPWALAPVLVISGMAIAPTLIASVAVVQTAVPAGRLAESLGWTQLGIAAGLAIGAVAIGATVDRWLAFGGFVGIAAAGVLLFLGSLLVRSPRAVLIRTSKPR